MLFPGPWTLDPGPWTLDPGPYAQSHQLHPELTLAPLTTELNKFLNQNFHQHQRNCAKCALRLHAYDHITIILLTYFRQIRRSHRYHANFLYYIQYTI
jgi:hypothetical protein